MGLFLLRTCFFLPFINGKFDEPQAKGAHDLILQLDPANHQAAKAHSFTHTFLFPFFFSVGWSGNGEHHRE